MVIKKQSKRIKKTTNLELGKEFIHREKIEIEKNVLKIIKNNNNSSKKH